MFYPSADFMWSGCTDTSDPRHFGPKTLRHHQDGSEMSGHFRKVPKCPYNTSAPVPNCLHLGHFLTCDVSKNEQSYALYRYNEQTYTKMGSDHRMTWCDS